MFCEQCGSVLEPGLRFCENCGAPVSEDDFQDSDTWSTGNQSFFLYDFSNEDWRTSYKKYIQDFSGENGIIVTKSKILCNQLGCAKDAFLDMIETYTEYSASSGVIYSLLDLDNQKIVDSVAGSVSNVVSALRKICEVSRPKYVFILGNEDVVAVSEWKNESYDSDETVTSDLSFQTLSLVSPWNGHNYAFDDVLRVGRLPSFKGESFEQFKSYFLNVMNSKNCFTSLDIYGLSAKVWKRESDYEFRKFGASLTDSAPDVTNETVEKRISPQTNILFFNLHGSDHTEYWYGQEESSYPEAFEPKNVNAIAKPFFLGVEACYGGKFVNNQTEEESIVVKAMQSGCIGFLGSSKIAYGTSNPPGSCADFVIGEFLKQITEGQTSGDAHVLGIKRLVEDSDDFDDAEIKTLAEFSLFGDPSQSINFGSDKKGRITGGSKSLFGKNSARTAKSIHVNIPDIRTEIKMSLAVVDEKINSVINEYIYKKYSAVRGIMPKTFKIEGKDLYQSVYQNNETIVRKTVKVYFDKNGKIKKELESK